MTEAPVHGSQPPQSDGATLAVALGALAGNRQVEALIERQIALAVGLDLSVPDRAELTRVSRG